MNCDVCYERYAMSTPIMLRDGLIKRVCIACAAQHAEPMPTAQGTQPGPRMTASNENIARLVEERTAQRDALAGVLVEVMRLFRRELGNGYSTAEQQLVLRQARALLEECK